uniref:Uncharacterized protein n=1 Tax=Arion vulgaris TaxID=1028688 RepID=A0A0B6Z5I8_9EUPU
MVCRLPVLHKSPHSVASTTLPKDLNPHEPNAAVKIQTYNTRAQGKLLNHFDIDTFL